MADEKPEEKFDPKVLQERLTKEIPYEQNDLALKVMEAYTEAMKARKDIEDKFNLSKNDAKKFAEDIMDNIRYHVLCSYLFENEADYQKVKFKKKGADALVESLTGINERALGSRFEMCL